MRALAKHYGTIFTGIFDIGRRPFKGSLTNTANFVIDVPRPTSDSVKAFDSEFEAGRRQGHCYGCTLRCLNSCITGSFRHFDEAEIDMDQSSTIIVEELVLGVLVSPLTQ